MPQFETLRHLDTELDAVPGTVSVWCGPLEAGVTHARHADVTHYAASTMKVAVLAALHRSAEAGLLDLDDQVAITNEFSSAEPAGSLFSCRQRYDNDDAVWDRLGERVSLRWLAQRMIVRSSNLATNLVLSRVGYASVAEVWRLVGARHSAVRRGIEDSVAAEAGITNLVTAADLAALLGAIARGASGVGSVASRASCEAMIATLLAQEGDEDLAAGLPSGTKVAHKNGWIQGVRHGAGVVYPTDAPPFVLAVCLSTPLAINEQNDKACQLVARIAAAAWADREQNLHDHEPGDARTH
jgi:beta-lactamase class A